MSKPMALAMIMIGLFLVVAGGLSLLADHKRESVTNPSQQETIAAELPKKQHVNSLTNVQEIQEHEASPAVDKAKEKGNNFEAYIVDILKYKEQFRILEWHQGATTPEGNYAENELLPDLKVGLPTKRGDDIVFWAECKYRSSLGRGFKIERYQHDRYMKYQKETNAKVLIMLGVGGKSSQPSTLYVVPLDSIQADRPINEAQLASYCVNPPREGIRKYIGDYFYDEVFPKSRKKR